MSNSRKDYLKKIRCSVYKRAIQKWGYRAQLEMAQEEATEFALSCRKFIRRQNEKTFNELASELADIKIMIEQLELMHPELEGMSKKIMKKKVDRLRDRLDRNVFTESEEE